MIYEICIDNVAAAITSEQLGASRVELCANLAAGGTTPSHGMIKTVREKINIDLFVMIRPREGNFIYSDEEFEIMKSDILTAKNLRADGVVFGLLNKDNNIDFVRTEELVKLARPMQVTFHRAFDDCADPFEAIHQLKKIGINRILTSGQQDTAIDGSELIKKLVQLAGDEIKILAGSGINETNVVLLVQKTEVKEIHFTCHKILETSTIGISDRGAANPNNYGLKIFDVEKFESIKNVLEKKTTQI